MQYDVFISYRREGGLDLARQLAQQLERLGVSCFFDLEEIQTGKFNEKIYEAIDNSRYFIFILSPRSLDRCANDGDWVRRELEHACSRGLLPIPVLWKGDSPSFPENLPETLRGISDVQVSFIDHDTAFRATVKQLIEERLDGVVTDSERKRRDAEETFLLKARRFKYDDYVIDKEERAELEAFAEKAGIDVEGIMTMKVDPEQLIYPCKAFELNHLSRISDFTSQDVPVIKDIKGRIELPFSPIHAKDILKIEYGKKTYK